MKSYESYFDSFLFEIDFIGQVLAQHNIRIMGLLEGQLELLKLLLAEYRSMTAFALRRLLLLLLIGNYHRGEQLNG